MRKVGELKGKPIIEGNPNEIKNNQIHYKESEGNINLSERKNGNLETISGSNSGSAESEVEYWKFVYDESEIPGTSGTAKWHYAADLLSEACRYISIINYVTPVGIVSNSFSTSGSNDITSENKLKVFGAGLLQKSVLGFCIYKGTTYTVIGNDFLVETPFKGLFSSIMYVLSEDQELPPEEVAILKEIFTSCCIPITKEEYYNL